MEALIVVTFALGAIVLLEAGYCIAICLTRWAPVMLIGVVAGWFAAHHGADHLETLGLGVLACMIARHVLIPRGRLPLDDDGYC